MTGISTEFYYEPAELAALLRVSESTIRRLIRRRTIGAITVGRQHRIPRRELIRLAIEAGLTRDDVPPTMYDLLDVLKERTDRTES
ncbi:MULTISPECIES: helix-turn-helix domain-containing protein [unclassified Deinococcus]|uniref:helix-turn-helix domain-containing protein n=1 Tax=unclassified Deinococcus TaxID=2623546 RepID=UPI001C2F606A|nr:MULTISPECIES: helix-turn-helix domain-containing protein [unclassified Deinococcus]MDK2010994.1 helix-turn-helix domain-containing protein [Deinococcus sp. 43]